MSESVKVPLVSVSVDVEQAMPDFQVSSVEAAPAPSGQFLILKLGHHRIDGYDRAIEGEVELALSLRAASILCLETGKALKVCLLDPLEETESRSEEDHG